MDIVGRCWVGVDDAAWCSVGSSDMVVSNYLLFVITVYVIHTQYVELKTEPVE